MSEKIEGTMSLEGLIEGPMPPFPDAQAKMEKWAEGFAGGAVRVNLQVDGTHFSAMPANAPVHVKNLAKDGGEPSHAIADSLADLLRLFPPLERGQVFSTLRSIEYRPKLQVQTVYAVGPDGRAATRQQTVPCDTVAAEEPLSRKEIIKQGVIGLIAAAAILGISSIWVDYRGIWRRMTARVEPTTVAVELATFEPYFKINVTGLDRRSGTLELDIIRTRNYPRQEAEFDALYNTPPEVLLPAPPSTAPATAASATTSTAPAATAPATAASMPAASMPTLPASLLRRRVAIESLAKGLVVLEFRDQSGNVLGQTALRIADLQQYDVVKTRVAAPIIDGRAVAPARIIVLPE